MRKALLGALVLGAGIGTAVVAKAPPKQVRYVITDLGRPPGGLSEAYSINAQGQVAGTSWASPTSNARAFVWSDDALTYLPPLAGHQNSSATAINDKGQVVGFSVVTGGGVLETGVVWNGGTPTSLAPSWTAQDINNAGQIVAPSPSGLTRWQNGVATVFPFPAGGFPRAINGHGAMAGSASRRAVRWNKDGGSAELGVLAGGLPQGSSAADLNDAGDVVGTSFWSDGVVGGQRAVLWKNGSMEALPFFNPTTRANFATAINNEGQIVGYEHTPPSGRHAILWEDGEAKDLNELIPPLTGWLLYEAFDINDSGQIVGVGYLNSSFDTDTQRGFLLTPIVCEDVDFNGKFDNDGDGLCDNWETEGVDVDHDGTPELDLKALGANLDHKDLFVEIDYLQGGAPHTDSPDDEALAMVEQAFDVAPVGNSPGEGPGIHLHLVGTLGKVDEALRQGGLASGAYLHPEKINFPELIAPECAPQTVANFNEIKHDSFGTPEERSGVNWPKVRKAKRLVFRYAVFAHNLSDRWVDNGSASGCVPNGSSGVAERPGNDLIVTLGWPDKEFTPMAVGCDSTLESPQSCGRRQAQAATFMHELGHTLSLRHGGVDDVNCKPNHLSVMNYAVQFPILLQSRALSYAAGRSLSVDVNDPFPMLVEDALVEPDGVKGQLPLLTVFGLLGRTAYTFMNTPVDWNADGPSPQLVSADINRLDAHPDCRPGNSVDGTLVAVIVPGEDPLDETQVPPATSFLVTVNNLWTGTPVNVQLSGRAVYLTLAQAVDESDVVRVSYTVPFAPASPLTIVDEDGASLVASFDGLSLRNVTGIRETLRGFDDWYNLKYDFKSSPDFSDGAVRGTVHETPEMSSDDVRAVAEVSDFDLDGVRTIIDNCLDVKNPDQVDSDGDGFGDACDPGGTVVDTTPPAIVPYLSAQPNAAGWHNQPVTVTWSIADPESGIASASGCDAVTVSTDTKGLTVVCVATNGGGLSASGAVTVQLDQAPPVVSCQASPSVLWPANHRLVSVQMVVSVSDTVSGPAGFVLSRVRSNEPDNGLGDGDTSKDVQGFDVGTGDVGGWLRAERSGLGRGRTYTLKYEARDRAGNMTACTSWIDVPHSRVK